MTLATSAPVPGSNRAPTASNWSNWVELGRIGVTWANSERLRAPKRTDSMYSGMRAVGIGPKKTQTQEF